jgi:large subunit ribosomal protein L30
MAQNGNMLKLTLLKSRFHRKPSHRQCLAGLGLRRRHQTVLVADTPQNRGMVNEVSYLLQIEEVSRAP